ncbi:ATPase with role in protein import into the ER [Mortierella sp. AD031]|nr:ATPase with role in protein import into the ER [Mortierella sp. AD031]
MRNTEANTDNIAIGIDIGDAYSRVGIYRNDKFEIVPNELGQTATPTYIAFVGEKVLVGQAARGQQTANPTNTIFDFKRLLGCRFDDENVQDDIRRLPFKIVESKSTKEPIVSVDIDGEEKLFHPVELYCIMLGKMKEIAEAYLSMRVTKAVVTVPTYFGDFLFSEIKDVAAGSSIGLSVQHVLQDSITAETAYGLDKKRHYFLAFVFDLGGSSLDVTLLSNYRRFLQVEVTNEKITHRRVDLDKELVDYWVRRFKAALGTKQDVTKDTKAMARLRKEIERARRTLSTETTSIEVNIESLFNGLDFSDTLTRDEFEELNDSIFNTLAETVMDLLAVAHRPEYMVEDILLVGGSSRIPAIRSMVQRRIDSSKVLEGIQPEETVVYGAALHAASYL